MIGIHLVFGARSERSTKRWSPMRSVSFMEPEGISKACMQKVMMKRPVTSTTAMEETNSAVVSFFFAGFSVVTSFSFSIVFGLIGDRLFYEAHYALPADICGKLPQTQHQTPKFITHGGRGWLRVATVHAEVDEQRTSHDVLARHEAPVAAVGAVVAVVAHHEVVAFGHDELMVLDQSVHFGSPVRVDLE